MEITSLILGVIGVVVILFIIRLVKGNPVTLKQNKKHVHSVKKPFQVFKIPKKSLNKMKDREESTIKEIIVHCSDTDLKSVTAEDINRWHLDRGWAGIGYHYFIRSNGIIEACRPLTKVGSHCYGHNKYSIGICVNGRQFEGNLKPREKSLHKLLSNLQNDLLVTLKIKGHRDYTNLKTCPNFDVSEFILSNKIIYNTGREG